MFGKQSGDFLSKQKGNLEILRVCLTYLCFSGFDDIFSEDFESLDLHPMGSQISAGDFSLFPYAGEFWFQHAQALGRTTEEDDSLPESVERFYYDRSQTAQTSTPEPNLEPFLEHFRSFSSDSDAQRSLAASARFLSRLKYGHIDPDGMFSLQITGSGRKFR